MHDHAGRPMRPVFFEVSPACMVSVLAIRSRRVRGVFVMRFSSGSRWHRCDARIAIASCPTEEKMDRATDSGQGPRMHRGQVRGSPGELGAADGRKFLGRRVVFENDFSGVSFIYRTGCDHLDPTCRSELFFSTRFRAVMNAFWRKPCGAMVSRPIDRFLQIPFGSMDVYSIMPCSPRKPRRSGLRGGSGGAGAV